MTLRDWSIISSTTVLVVSVYIFNLLSAHNLVQTYQLCWCLHVIVILKVFESMGNEAQFLKLPSTKDQSRICRGERGEGMTV